MTQNGLKAQFNVAATGAKQTALSDKLQTALDGQYADARNKARAFISRPELAPVPADLPKDVYRELTLDRVKMMIDEGFTRMPYNPEFGGDGELIASINAGEVIAHADLSLAVKQGVQFGLFGTSIERLGTDKHQHLIEDIITGNLLGGFAMTEMSCGSDVQGTQTEAYYDHETRSFTINTPNEEARKTYIGNAALHGRMMVVFAQLKMDAQSESEGVHAFLVPIRDEDGNTMPGVTIEDNGHKIGLNGIDNGILSFDGVSVPYDNMLDRFGQIDENGKYQSEIAKKTARFFTMIGTLVTGRVFISMISLSGCKNALAAAVDNAENRITFGDKLIDKQRTQTRLLPRIAEAYAMHFATRDLMADFERDLKGGTEEDKRNTETKAAALKATSSDRAMATISECRNLAGGKGYMSTERYGVLRNDVDVFHTFEGDNNILRMLVAKNMMTRLANKFKDASSTLGRLVKKVAMSHQDRMARYEGTEADRKTFLDPAFQQSLFAGRERAMMHRLFLKIVSLNSSRGKDIAGNWCQDDMAEYGDAYSDRLQLESFIKAVEDQKDPELKALLKDVCDLYAVHTLRENSLWYLENGHLSADATHALVRLRHELNQKIAPHAKTLVDGFGIPENLLKGCQPSQDNIVGAAAPSVPAR